MAPKTLSVTQAKAAFSAAVQDAEAGATVVITRHGRAVAALVRADDLATIERHRAAQPPEGLASLSGGWAGSARLVQAIASSMRRPTRTGLRPSTSQP